MKPVEVVNRTGAERELEAIFQYASLGIVFSRNQIITRTNQAFETMFGYAPAELTGQKSRVIFADEASYQSFSDQVKPKLSRGQPLQIYSRFMRSDGQLITCKVSASAINLSAEYEGTVWLFEDITELEMAEHEIHQATMEFEAVMNNSPAGIIFTSNRQITRFNPKFCEMFGYSAAEAKLLTGRDLFPSNEAYDHLGDTAYPLLSRGVHFQDELELVRNDGSHFWAEVTAYVVDGKDTSRGTIWTISDCSEVKASREALRSSISDIEAILESAPVGIVFTKNRVILNCNSQAEELFGVDPGTLTGKSTCICYPSEKDFIDTGNELFPLMQKGEIQARERLMIRQNGESFWCRITGRIRDVDHPAEGGSIWVLEDLTYRRRAEQALANANAVIQTVLNNANVSIIATGADGVVRLMNKTSERWLGYPAGEIINKATPERFHDPEEIELRSVELAKLLKRPVRNRLEVFSNQIKGYGGHDREWTYIRKDGSRLPIHLTVTAEYDPAGTITGYIMVGVDLTERQKAEEASRQAQISLEHQVSLRTSELAEANSRLVNQMEEQVQIELRMRQLAHFDPLTGLPNRNLLIERLDQSLGHAMRHKQRVGILFIDLDHFKNINDTLGHQVGDSLLGQVAKRMSFALRDTDTLGRLGGDEFLLLVPKVTSNAKLAIIADKLIEVLTQPIDIDSHLLHITPSIGICCYPEHGEDAETLMRNADTAMYHAKSCGRNNYKFFVDKLNAEVDKRFQIETALRYAESQGELEIVFQPIVESNTRQIVSVEALLRWHSAALGDVPPSEFIPIAEESGTMVPIGEWVLRESCRQIMKLRCTGFPNLSLAVNLSPRQFRQPDLVRMVAEILDDTRLPPESLKLEITESSLMHNVTDVISTLHQLVALGVQLSIDDFGTGYSSLAYLKDFPVHTLKIDRSFVRDLGHDTRCEGVVRTIIALAKTLGLSALAEGVETQYQRDQLHTLGCEFFQGYFFYRPMSFSQLTDALSQ